MSMATRFEAHIEKLRSGFSDLLNEHGFECLVLDSGELQYAFEDDQSLPFRAAHHYQYWCPFDQPQQFVVVQPATQPKLLSHVPNDFWHRVEKPAGEWTSAYVIEEFASVEKQREELKRLKKAVYLGPRTELARELGLTPAPMEFWHQCNWLRGQKTPYEIETIAEANAIAAKGHIAAKESFFAGASEYEIFQNYHVALQTTDNEQPYSDIVAVGENCAVLHYQVQDRQRKTPRSFLIDAGARLRGYASDITRSYAGTEAPQLFHEMVAALDKAQVKLCEQARLGQTFVDLHRAALLGVGGVLADLGIVKGDVQQAIDAGVVEPFFPHGVGHLLGILVHDIGGKQADPKASTKGIQHPYKYLRSNRELLENMVLTIEPGIYFIDSLLTELQSSKNKDLVDWRKVEELRPCGGIRIEDNVVVTTDGARNLTRPHLP